MLGREAGADVGGVVFEYERKEAKEIMQNTSRVHYNQTVNHMDIIVPIVAHAVNYGNHI